MDNPGSFSLGDLTITAPGTFVLPVMSGLDGMSACALQARFAYGAGGITCKAYVQTTFDQSQTWFDVACFAFGTVGAVMQASLVSSAAAPLPGTDGTLYDNAVRNGPLGDQLRVKVVVTGTYNGATLLSVWANAK